jgi:hypothetical protein
MTIYISLLLCISGFVPQRDADTFALAASQRGYDVLVGWDVGCAATLHASDSDWADVSMLGYDDGTLDGGRRVRLTSERAEDIIISWEARLQ